MHRIKDNRHYRMRGIIYHDCDINKLKMFSKESLDHWITKSLIFRLLREMKHDVVTEFEIVGMGIGDIFDLTTSTQYEVETTNSKPFCRKRAKDYVRMGVEIIVVPTKNLSRDWKERHKQLKDYVLPD